MNLGVDSKPNRRKSTISFVKRTGQVAETAHASAPIATLLEDRLNLDLEPDPHSRMLKQPPARRFQLRQATRWLPNIAVCLLLTALCGCLGEDAKLDSNVLVWGRKGLDQGRFIKPRAITVDAQDRIYIVDMTSRIQVASRDGEILQVWRTPACVQGKPCGLSISNDGLLMVCDTHYFRVLFYTPDGELVEERTIGGTNGRGPGEFGFVTDVVQDSRGNYYVSEYGDYDRIQKFSPDGKYVYQWGGHGTAPGKF